MFQTEKIFTMNTIQSISSKVSAKQVVPVVAGIAAAIIFRRPLLRMASGLLTSKAFSPIRASIMALAVEKGRAWIGKK